jgi:ABC-type sugar transport system substrate-binding protein
MNGNCKPIQNQGKGLWQSSFAFSISALFAGLLLALIPASSVSAQSTKKHKIGALTKSLSNPYFLLMKQRYEYSQKKLGVQVVFGRTPTEEADAGTAQHLAELVGRRHLGGLRGYPVSGDFPQQRLDQG